MGFRSETFRYWLIVWMYLVAFGHFAMGVLLAWFSGLDIFNQYHYGVLSRFDITSQANAQNMLEWWIALFAATVQSFAIFMGTLTYVGNKFRSSIVWVWMIVGLVVWAPQDILISLRIDFWLHVWIDVTALILMLPPLITLWWIDRVKVSKKG